MNNNIDVHKTQDNQTCPPKHNNQSPEHIISTKKYYARKIIIITLALFTVLLTIFAYQLHVPTSSGYILKSFNLYSLIKYALTDKEKIKLMGEDSDRVNVLLLGMPGIGHDGPYLTDTIIIASLKPSTKEIALISIPRDLIVPLEGYGLPKINSINSIGEAQQKDSGGIYTMQTITKVFGINIPYYVRINFTGFEKLIDDIGGIEVDVERSFTDRRFPTKNNGVTVLSFEQGKQMFNGKRALQFARSRYGTNGENSDFARMKRQQKIFKAIQDKVSLWYWLINTQTIQNALTNFSEYTQTNLEITEILRLADLTVSSKHYIFQSLTNNGNRMVTDSTGVDGSAILKPTSENYNDIHLFINNIFQ